MRYEDYKKVDLPWLEEVPSHWEIVRNKNLFKHKKDILGNESEFAQLLSLTTMGIKKINIEESKGKTPMSYDTYQKVCKDDLVLCLFDLDVSAVFSDVSKYCGMISPAYQVFESDIVYMNYYKYIFDKIFQDRSYKLHSKSLRYTITPDNFLMLDMIVPPKEEQMQIARFLDWKINEIDSLIEQKKKKVELIETVYNETLNKNFNILNDGEVIKIKLKNFAKLQNGISESGDFFTDGNPFVSYSAVYNNTFLPTNIRDKAKSSKSQQEQFSVMEGDIFITRTSEKVSDAFMVSLCEKTIEKSTFSGFLIRARMFKENIIPKFLLFYLMTDEIREELLKNLNLVTRVSISQDLIKNLSFAIPTLEYQKEIIRKCEKITKQKNILKNNISLQINNLKQLKQSLISDVVTGKIDVRKVDIPDYEMVIDVVDEENLEDDFDKEV